MQGKNVERRYGALLEPTGNDMLTSSTDIRDFMMEMYEPEWHSSIYRQISYTYGEPQREQGISQDSGRFPHFPDVSPKSLMIAQSRMILNAQFSGLAKVMYNDPEAEYPTLDPITGETRKNFLLARWRAGGWSNEEHAAYIEGRGCGIGFLQHGLVKGPTGKQMVTVRHSPTVLTLCDRGERNPYRWRGIVFVQYIPADIAKSRWGAKAVEPHLETHYDGTNSQPVRALRVFEYYDTGFAGGTPTRAIIPGNFDAAPLERKANEFGMLPMSCYVHFLAPGMRKPIGEIVLSMAIQQGINEVEDYQRSVMVSGRGFDVGRPGDYEAQDLKAIRDGKGIRFVRRTTAQDTAGPWERVPPMEMSQTSSVRLESLHRQFTAATGQTDADRGQFTESKRTATENQIVDQRSQTQGSWSVRQTIAFRESTFLVAASNAALFDREPTTIEFFGGQAVVNDPMQPDSIASEFCSEICHPKISEEAVTFMDVRTKQQVRMNQLNGISQYVGTMISPRWFGEELMKAMNEKDFRKALMIPDTLAPQQPMMEGGVEDQLSGLGVAAPVPQG